MQMRSLYLYFEVFVSVQKFSVLITLIFWYIFHQLTNCCPAKTVPILQLADASPLSSHPLNPAFSLTALVFLFRDEAVQGHPIVPSNPLL